MSLFSYNITHFFYYTKNKPAKNPTEAAEAFTTITQQNNQTFRFPGTYEPQCLLLRGRQSGTGSEKRRNPH